MTFDPYFQMEAARFGYHSIVTHMLDELPDEAVGLLWSDGSVSRLINQARSPSRFSVSQPQLAEAMDKVSPDLLLVGLYHSHPGGKEILSAEDEDQLRLQFTAGIPIPWLIINPSGNLKAWWWSQEDCAPAGTAIVEMEVAGV